MRSQLRNNCFLIWNFKWIEAFIGKHLQTTVQTQKYSIKTNVWRNNWPGFTTHGWSTVQFSQWKQKDKVESKTQKMVNL